MKIKFILEKKNDNKTEKRKIIIKDMFSQIFNNVNDRSFDIDFEKEKYTVNYKAYGKTESIYYLIVYVLDTKKSVAAKILNDVKNKLLKGAHRKEFKIIVSYDESSEYYCEKLAPRFGKFERLMRDLIYSTITIAQGNNWFTKTFNEEQIVKYRELCNSRNISEVSEKILYELTFDQLHKLLFEEHYKNSPENVVNQLLNCDNIENLEKEYIISKIKLCEKTTVWDEFFSENDFDLHKYLTDMRKYRNMVAHNKLVSYNDYQYCTKNLRVINKQLEEAINRINSKVYTDSQLIDLNITMREACEKILETSRKMGSLVQDSMQKIERLLHGPAQIMSEFTSLAHKISIENRDMYIRNYKLVSFNKTPRIKMVTSKEMVMQIQQKKFNTKCIISE